MIDNFEWHASCSGRQGSHDDDDGEGEGGCGREKVIKWKLIIGHLHKWRLLADIPNQCCQFTMKTHNDAVRKVALAALTKAVFNDENEATLIKISKMATFDFWKLATL